MDARPTRFKETYPAEGALFKARHPGGGQCWDAEYPEIRSAPVAYLALASHSQLSARRSSDGAFSRPEWGWGEALPISSRQTGVLRVSVSDHPMFQVFPTPGNPT